MNRTFHRHRGTGRLSRRVTGSLASALRLLLHVHDHPEMRLVSRFLALEPPLYPPVDYSARTAQGHPGRPTREPADGSDQ
ncbi:hypothetical protein ACIBUR_29150 [Streptomyces anulatus]